MVKTTQKTLGGRKLIKIQKTLGGKVHTKIQKTLGGKTFIKIKNKEKSSTSWALLGLWLDLRLPCDGLHLIVDPISLEHLLDSIIGPWIWVAITDHPTSSIYVPN